MSITKKIFGSIFILVCLTVVLAVYNWRQGRGTEFSAEKLSEKLLEMDLIDSPLGKLDYPDLDFDLPFDLGNFKLGIPDLSAGEGAEVSVQGNMDINYQGAGAGLNFGGGQAVDESVCRQFDAAPSCIFVPSEYRDLCEQCKNQ